MIRLFGGNKLGIIVGILILCSLTFTANAEKDTMMQMIYKSLAFLNEKDQQASINNAIDESKLYKWSSRMLQEEVKTMEERPDGMSHNKTSTDKEPQGLRKVLAGIGYSFLFIFLSEIGDKTFLFIVIYATKMNPVKLLIVSSFGICTMHVLGVLVGDVFQYFLTPFWVKLITVVSFFIFGVILIYTGITAEPETEDLDTKLKEIEVEMMSKRSKLLSEKNEEEVLSPEDVELNIESWNEPTKVGKIDVLKNILTAILFNESAKVILSIFISEMGDRSQISAVGLAAVYDFWTVAIAGSAGHVLAMFLAIVFGRVISNYTSEKCINIAGGILFLIFSAYSIVVYYVLDEEAE